MTAIREVTTNLIAKAKLALVNDGDTNYDDAARIEHENEFFDEVEQLMTPESWEDFDHRNFKAATNERIEDALNTLFELGFIDRVE